MRVTSFEGIVENGHIRLSGDVHLPEKTKVYVVVPEFKPRNAYVGSPQLVHPEQITDLKKEVVEESSDARL